MSTWRCLGCDGLYMAPHEGFGRAPHACPPLRDPGTGREHVRPGHRDENYEQDPATGTVTMRAGGAGRVLVDDGDVLLDATPEDLAELRTRPPRGPVPHPDPPPRVPEVWISQGGNR